MGKASRAKKESAADRQPDKRTDLPASGHLPGQGVLQKTGVHILLIIVLGFLCYSNTFNSPFQWDEVTQITNNPVIKDLNNFMPGAKGREFASDTYNPRRIVGYFTFALNYRFGGLNVTGYHIVNLLIHLISAVLVYFLVVLTFKTPYFVTAGIGHMAMGNGQWTKAESNPSPITSNLSPSASPFTLHYSHLIALFSALLFVCHPVQTQAITYVVQRFASLAAMFYLLSLVFYIKGRLWAIGDRHGEKNLGQGRLWAIGEVGPKVPIAYRLSPIAYFFFSLVFAVCAVKTKETAFTLPLVIMVYEFTFFKSSLRKKLLFLLPVLLTLIIVAISVLPGNKSLGEMLSDVSESTRVETSIPRWDYLLTQTRVLTTYLRLIVLPVNQNLDYDYPIEHSFFTLPVILSSLLLAALLGAALWLLYRSRQGAMGYGQGQFYKGGQGARGKGQEETGENSVTTPMASGLSPIACYRFIAFGILWFFITISIESSVIPIADVIFEHRLYLPVAGLFAAITTGVFLAAQRLRMERAAIALLVLATLIFSGVTYARNLVWSNKTTFWEDVERKSPNKARVHLNLGSVYYSEGRMEDALREFQLVLSARPDYAEAHNNLGSVYASLGRLGEAGAEFQAAVRLRPDYADAHYNLGKYYFALNRLNEALAEFQTAVKLKPGHADAHNNLGAVYETLGRVEDAVREYQTCLRIDPNNVHALKNLNRIKSGLKP